MSSPPLLAPGSFPDHARNRPIQQAIQKQRLAKKRSAILRIPADQPAPLSYPQQPIWFLTQLNPQNPFYNMPEVVRIRGPFVYDALVRSLSLVLERHSALRMRFDITREGPVQRVDPDFIFGLTTIDFSGLPLAQAEEEAHRLYRNEGVEPFDLKHKAPFRARLVRLAEEDHVLLMTIHHIVSDNWSVGILIREMTTAYQDFCAGRTPYFPELELQYVDFADWQRKQQPEKLESLAAYWTSKLADFQELRMPFDRARPLVQRFRGRTHRFVLSKSSHQQLLFLAEREGVTLFMVLVAGIKLLFHRYTGQEDILIGTPVAGRARRELEGLVGLFANTILLRTALESGLRFSTLLQRVRSTVLEAMANQEMPFERIVESLRVQRTMDRNPVFQLMFILQNTPDLGLVSTPVSGITFKPLELDNASAKFDLLIEHFVVPDGLRVGLEYNSDLFDASTIERLAGHYECLLESIGRNPGRELVDYELESVAEESLFG